MSYATIYQCANDSAFVERVTACCAQESDAPPAQTATEVLWPVAAASDVEAAYASALAADNPDPGGDETVITDAMILSHVQANLPAEP